MKNMMRAVAYCFLALPNLVVTTAIYNHFGGDPWRLPLLGLLYGAVIFLTVLVHEAGHALAASIFGWRIALFAVFPLAYRPKSRKLQFWTLPSGDLGGAVALERGGARIRSELFWFAAAGPIANFVFSGAAYAVLYMGSSLENLAGSVAVTSFFVGLGNLLPWRSRNGAKSDGAVILAKLSRKQLL